MRHILSTFKHYIIQTTKMHEIVKILHLNRNQSNNSYKLAGQKRDFTNTAQLQQVSQNRIFYISYI